MVKISATDVGYIPIGVEFGIASLLSLVLLAKPRSKGNFPIAISYSCFKIFATSSIITSYMNFFELSQLPFYCGLLLNEVVLLVWSIQMQELIRSVPVSKLYSPLIRTIRCLSEITTTVTLVGVSVVITLLECPCKNWQEVEFFGQSLSSCEPSHTEAMIGGLLRNQLRGLAFVLTVTASAVAISSVRFVASSMGQDMSGKDRNVMQWMMRDAPWRQRVRAVYGVLGIFVNGLFVFTFFYRGTNVCSRHGDDAFMYGMGDVPGALLNSALAISQVFMADMMLRIAQKARDEKLEMVTKNTSDTVESESDDSSQHELGGKL